MKLVVIIFAFIALTKANSADFLSCSLECYNDNAEFNPTSQHASESRLNLLRGKSGPRGMKGDRGQQGRQGETDLTSIPYLKKQLVNLTDDLRNSARETNELRDDLRNSARETNELRDELTNSARETNELRTTVEILADDLRNSERETNELRITFATLTESLRPQNCSQIKEHYPASETGIYTIYENKLSSIGKQVGCDMSGQRTTIPKTCGEILQSNPSSANGVYKIFVEPSTITNVYCDMSDEGIKVYETCGEILRSNPSSANGVYSILVEPSTITNVYCDMSDEGIEIKPQTCDEILQWNSSATNGVYEIVVDPTSAPTDVYCKMSEGGWTVFQRRFDGSTDFRRNFEAYTNGFGDKSSEYWMGLENLYQMTKTGRYELYIKLLAYDGEERFAKYSDFSIGSGPGYILHIGSYSGDAGESLTYSNGMKYSTEDNDQDDWSGHCSRDYNLGAWWFSSNCGYSNLNAHTYGSGERRSAKAMFWSTFKGWSTPMKETTMMVRKLN